MTTQHTPGPWCVESALTLPDGRFLPASIIEPDSITYLATATTWEPAQQAECDANMMLMAAAPELLAALRNCVDFLEDCFGGVAEPTCLDTARAAIAKATGQAYPDADTSPSVHSKETVIAYLRGKTEAELRALVREAGFNPDYYDTEEHLWERLYGEMTVTLCEPFRPADYTAIQP
jgi:hypothetical protein